MMLPAQILFGAGRYQVGDLEIARETASRLRPTSSHCPEDDGGGEGRRPVGILGGRKQRDSKWLLQFRTLPKQGRPLCRRASRTGGWDNHRSVTLVPCAFEIHQRCETS